VPTQSFCLGISTVGMSESDKACIVWADLEPDEEILAALYHAGDRPEAGDQNEKRHWSERFAHASAVAIANEVRRCRQLPSAKKVLPLSLAQGTEPLTPLGAGTTKRIDVTVADPVLGLELGFSLKGLNFKDAGSGNYDKNLTGRLYELGDEVRMVHEHLPHAFMVGVFFLPMECTADKSTGQSSFAHTVAKLRDRTGRLDFALAGHAPRCDSSWVALYTLGIEPQGFARGLARFFNVQGAPPHRGRPQVDLTLSLKGMVDSVVAEATGTTGRRFSDPEPEGPDSHAAQITRFKGKGYKRRQK
jgi:hypothetical protein